MATTPWTRADAIEEINEVLAATDSILAQCELTLAVETAQVVVLPSDLLDFQGNEPGSFGGHPPPGTPNPRLFNYNQDERLTSDAREYNCANSNTHLEDYRGYF